MSTFSVIDYLVLGAYLAGMITIGALFSRRQKSLKEYYHAGGAMPWWAVGISLFATLLSPISYLAGPGWVFARDSRYMLVPALIAIPLVFLSVAIWLPVWSRLRVMSIYEYLEMRFHPAVRTIGATLFIIQTIFWLGTALVTASMGFESVTGFDGRWCMVIIAALATAYTTLGGMRAVIWTDVAQFLVFVGGYGIIALIILAEFNWQPMEIYQLASQVSTETGYPHTQVISFELSFAIEASFWAILFTQLFIAISYGSSQMAVQRMHAAGSRRAMFKAMFAGSFVTLLFALIAVPVSWGFVAFYVKYPELSGSIEHPDQVLPHFVVQQLPVILRSLLMAGVLAALMSSFDSALNSMGSVIISDFYRRYLAPRRSENHYVLVSKILTVLLGLLLLTFSLSQYGSSDNTAGVRLGKLTNLVAAPILAFFLLGIFTRRTNTPGAMCGVVAGIAFAMVFNGFPGVFEPLYDGINWMWISGLGLTVNLLVGYTASFLFKPPSQRSLTNLTTTTWDNRDQQE